MLIGRYADFLEGWMPEGPARISMCSQDSATSSLP